MSSRRHLSEWMEAKHSPVWRADGFKCLCLMTDWSLNLTRPSLSLCLPPTVWRIRYVSSERGTAIKTNSWIDVRQAVVSLPCFFCLCPASALPTSSLSLLYFTVCLSRSESFLQRHRISSHVSVTGCSSGHSEIINLWHSTAAVFFSPLRALTWIWYTAAFLNLHGLDTSLLSTECGSTVSEFFEWRVKWGLFLTLLVCFYLNETLHIYLESTEEVIHDLALWPLWVIHSVTLGWYVATQL